MRYATTATLFLLAGMTSPMLATHAAEPNYDEAAVGQYTLPDVLAGPDGKPVSSAEAWKQAARPYQLELLEKFV